MLRAKLKLAVIAVFALGIAAARADDAPPIPIPDGFVAQRLDVTKGWIARPKDWFYESHGTPSGWLWTIAKEGPSKGEYETGMHIQMLIGFKKHGTTSESFLRDFIGQKRAEDKVLSDCESKVGDFQRICLEVLEGKFHIQYSAYWNPDTDYAFLATFGTPADKWNEFKAIEQAMANVVVIGADFGQNKDSKKE
jgi:hypothetical protein